MQSNFMVYKYVATWCALLLVHTHALKKRCAVWVYKTGVPNKHRVCYFSMRVNTCVNKSLFQALKSSPVVLLVSHRRNDQGATEQA